MHIRKSAIEWTALIASALVLYIVLFHEPLIGMADNGDFARIMHTAGLHDAGSENEHDRYFGYFHSKYRLAHPGNLQYASTEVPILFLAVQAKKLLSNSPLFDIRWLSALYAAGFLAALLLQLRIHRKLRPALYLFFALLAVTMLTDIGNIAYFNSFFSESVSFIFLLLTWGCSVWLARQETPRISLLLLYTLCAVFLIGSKTQDAPLGVVLSAIPLLTYAKRQSRFWRKLTAICASFILLSAFLLFITAPKELRAINLYQSVFYGIAKDSPAVLSDLKDLGLSPGLAVLAGTNYFTPNTAIPKSGPLMSRQFYAHMSYVKIGKYYATHPGRLWQKLAVSAQHAMSPRPLYLGNYEKSAHLPYRAVSPYFALWSRFKSDMLPHSAWLLLAFFALYFMLASRRSVFVRRYGGQTERDRTESFVYLLWGGAAIISFAVPVLGDGEADMNKHLFLFSAMFDLMLLSIVFWLLEAAGHSFRSLPAIFRK